MFEQRRAVCRLFRELYFVQRVVFKVFFWRHERIMGLVEADTDKEWLVMEIGDLSFY